ncbi:LysR family transcriptional regulator [Kiloniella sp. b19]|uniref:LysR family transcriptional regulator n=1 Tax=Kiloniella sp. GXU_MW_B19 TaxID=3141326 RepID=UPI0031E2547E
MNWEDLKLFDAAVSARGIAAAARTLGLSQPQLSRRLRRFEDEMGARLFDRTPNGLMLTPAGERLVPIAAEMKKIASGLDRIQPEIANSAERVIRISLDEVRERFLLRHAKWLHEQLPGIRIEIHSAHLHLDHATRETDIQIRSCLPESETLVARKLGEINYRVYASRQYLATTTEQPLQDPNWVSFAAERCWYPVIAQWYRDHVDEAFSVLKVNTENGMLYALQENMGYGVLPEFMGDAAVELVRIDSLGLVDVSSEHLIIHRDLLRDAQVKKTVRAIAMLFKRNLAALDQETGAVA